MESDGSAVFPYTRRHFAFLGAVVVADIIYLRLTEALIPAAVVLAACAYLFGCGLRPRPRRHSTDESTVAIKEAA